jgi:hypothetical protein
MGRSPALHALACCLRRADTRRPSRTEQLVLTRELYSTLNPNPQTHLITAVPRQNGEAPRFAADRLRRKKGRKRPSGKLPRTSTSEGLRRHW